VTSVGENEEKANTIQPPPFLCFSHLHPKDAKVDKVELKKNNLKNRDVVEKVVSAWKE